MRPAGMPLNNQVPWPHRPQEEQRERIIGEVFGNVRIEHPEITREMVAQRLAIRQQIGCEADSVR